MAGAVLHGPVLHGPQRWLASRPAQALGRWSYGIFLWGYIVQKLITEINPDIPTAPHLALTFAGAITLGAASWRYIESPAMRRVARRRHTPGAARSKTGHPGRGGHNTTVARRRAPP